MAYQAAVYRVLIASPGDVGEERAAVPEVIHRWNDMHSKDTGTVLLPVKWETNATPEMGARPQEIINKQIVADSDVLVGIFWTRLGTPTGRAESGTAEEIEEFIQAGKRVLLYFSSRPVTPDSVDLDQYARLKDFRQKCELRGLCCRYNSVDDLKDLLLRHITATVGHLRGQSAAERTAAERDANLELRREQMLRQEYILSHDGLTPGIMAGTEPLPAAWVAARRKQLGWGPNGVA